MFLKLKIRYIYGTGAYILYRYVLYVVRFFNLAVLLRLLINLKS
jgi:hypothetical protein